MSFTKLDLLARGQRAVEIAFSGKKIESLPTNLFAQGQVVRPSIDTRYMG
jgi:hypothetical protein